MFYVKWLLCTEDRIVSRPSVPSWNYWCLWDYFSIKVVIINNTKEVHDVCNWGTYTKSENSDRLLQKWDIHGMFNHNLEHV